MSAWPYTLVMVVLPGMGATTSFQARHWARNSASRAGSTTTSRTKAALSLHASVRCAVEDRQALEQLCSYSTRQILGNERV